MTRLVLAVVLVLVVSAIHAQQYGDSMACLKLQLWSNDDCSGDPDDSATSTVPTVPSDECGKCVYLADHLLAMIIIIDSSFMAFFSR